MTRQVPPHGQLENQFYKNVLKYAENQGHGNPETVGSTGLHLIRKLKKMGIVPTKILRTVMGGKRGQFKTYFVYRPPFGPFRDIRFQMELTIKTLRDGSVRWSIEQKFATQAPRASEVEYEIAGDAFHVGFKTPDYNILGMKMPPMFLKTGDVDVRDRTFTGSTLTSKPIIRKRVPLSGYYQMKNRELEAAERRKHPEEQRTDPPKFQPHPANPDWVMLSRGRGRPRAGEKKDPNIYWARPGEYIYNERGAVERKNVGEPVSASDVAYWKRHIHDAPKR